MAETETFRVTEDGSDVSPALLVTYVAHDSSRHRQQHILKSVDSLQAQKVKASYKQKSTQELGGGWQSNNVRT
jgi:hypothetical protein